MHWVDVGDKLKVSMICRLAVFSPTEPIESYVQTVAEVVHKVALVEVFQQVGAVLVLDGQKLPVPVASRKIMLPVNARFARAAHIESGTMEDSSTNTTNR